MSWVGPGADWRDAEAYTPLLDADRQVFAWEWLRRDPGYRADAARAREAGRGAVDPGRWGLHRFEDPARAAPSARPLWRSDHHSFVVKAKARAAAAPSDAIELGRLLPPATMAADREGEHWLLTDGLRAVRLDLIDGTGIEGPVELRYRLSGRASASGPLLALRRLLALAETGGFSSTLHPREPKARRWLLALRTHDALAVGAGQRQITAGMLGEDAAGARWRINAASLRSQGQRLVRAARRFANGGYRDFLR